MPNASGPNKYEKSRSKNFVTSSSTAGDGEGDVIFNGEESVVAGKVYYLAAGEVSGLAWTLTDADAEASSKNLLAVALGTGTSSTVGMLLRGMVKLYTDPGTGPGVPMYLSTTPGLANRAQPTASGDVIRCIGYQVEDTGKIWFNPEATYILIA